MTIKELYEDLPANPFTFEYKESLYYISLGREGYQTLSSPEQENYIIYKDFESLINNFMVDNKPLKDVIQDISCPAQCSVRVFFVGKNGGDRFIYVFSDTEVDEMTLAELYSALEGLEKGSEFVSTIKTEIARLNSEAKTH